MASESPYETTFRPEIHGMIPETANSFLDVGCNDGGFGGWLKGVDDTREVWGIEPNLEQAAHARSRCDHVLSGMFPEVLDQIDRTFDLVTFNHVLEHIVDPWSTLRRTRRVLSTGGSIVAVIPNIQYILPLFDLAVRGRWTYTDSGILDRTHLRFFTHESVIDLFEQAGLRVEELRPVNALASVRYPRTSRVAAFALRDRAFGGFAVRASVI